jgi:hypothetical protein
MVGRDGARKIAKVQPTPPAATLNRWTAAL